MISTFQKKIALLSSNVDGCYRQLHCDQMDCVVVVRYRMEWILQVLLRVLIMQVDDWMIFSQACLVCGGNNTELHVVLTVVVLA